MTDDPTIRVRVDVLEALMERLRDLAVALVDVSDLLTEAMEDR